MPNDIDKSLLDRLQALRGASEPPESSPKISVDTIERAKTPTREDTLAARLKSLRSQDDSPQPKNSSSPAPATAPRLPQKDAGVVGESSRVPREEHVYEAFQTDDQTLEDLLADLDEDEGSFAVEVTAEPDDAKVKALLEELADSIPKDEKGDRPGEKGGQEEQDAESDDDSDGEKMGKDVDDVIKRFRDEVEMEKKFGAGDDSGEDKEDDAPLRTTTEPGQDDTKLPSLDDLPSVPATTASPSSAPSDLTSLTSRLAALRTADDDLPSDLPSVPTSKPAKALNRLTSRTNYTDEDADSWCTVCLEDATLRCLGCDGDVYCARCWREMHKGERAGFEERSHRAVEFGREGGKERKRRVMVGAS